MADGTEDIIEMLFPPVNVKDELNGVLSSSNSKMSSAIGIMILFRGIKQEGRDDTTDLRIAAASRLSQCTSPDTFAPRLLIEKKNKIRGLFWQPFLWTTCVGVSDFLMVASTRLLLTFLGVTLLAATLSNASVVCFPSFWFSSPQSWLSL